MTNTRIRIAAALAAISFTAVSIPAFAQGADPEATATTAKPKLSGKAKSVVLCRPESKEAGAKTVCKSRGKWIREGKDPLGEY